MRTPYYREQALEGIAREVITAYDPNLYYGVPRMIPIEDIIEAQGITLEYQCLRKTGCVLGETIFDDGGAIIYDYDIPGYTVIAVKGGTILIDSSLCREDASTGRLRFTCAHELAHWLLHKRLYSGTGESAAVLKKENRESEAPWNKKYARSFAVPSARRDGSRMPQRGRPFPNIGCLPW